jgi:hypothetical protein
MMFKPAEPDENFFYRWVSTGGRWEMGFTQMMFGVRVRVGRVGCGCVDVDLCAGADRQFQDELLRAVMTVLIPVAEDIGPREMSDMFPRYNVKPINLDPVCWPTIKAMADAVLATGQKAS